ncbi:pilus assembly protein FimV [Gammaproteobacteria bacterium]
MPTKYLIPSRGFSSTAKRYAVLIALLTSLSSAVIAQQEYGPTQPGETLRKIAEKIRGSGTTTPVSTLVKRIYELNPKAFTGGKNKRLRIGVMLRIPENLTTNSTPQPSPMPAEPPALQAKPEIPQAKNITQTSTDEIFAKPETNVTPSVDTHTTAGESPAFEAVHSSTAQPTTPENPASSAAPIVTSPHPLTTIEKKPSTTPEPTSLNPPMRVTPTEGVAAPAPVGLWTKLAGTFVFTLLMVALLLKLRGSKAKDHDRPVDPESKEDLVARAKQESAAGNYNLARSVLRNAIATHPKDLNLRLKLLEVEYAQGDSASFSADADELKTFLGGREEELWGQVETMGRLLCPHLPPFCPPVEAIARREASSALTPEYSIPELVQRAEQELALGNYNLARSALRQAIALSPHVPELRLHLLRIEYMQGDRASFSADAEDLLALHGNLAGEILEELNKMRSNFNSDQTGSFK